jgi:hypothetical protein
MAELKMFKRYAYLGYLPNCVLKRSDLASLCAMRDHAFTTSPSFNSDFHLTKSLSRLTTEIAQLVRLQWFMLRSREGISVILCLRKILAGANRLFPNPSNICTMTQVGP